MLMLMGGNPNAMMDQDDATFCQAQTFSSGRLGLQGQTKLPGAFKLSLALEMMGEDPSMAFNMFGV